MESIEALYKKMCEEQDGYRNWLLSLPPKEILWHCYEYTIREDIVGAVEYMDDLSDEACEKLLASSSPLADVLYVFNKYETSHMSDIEEAIRECAEEKY